MAMHFAIFLIVGLVSHIPEEKSIFWCSWAKLKQLIKKKKRNGIFLQSWTVKGYDVKKTCRILHKPNAMWLRSFG